MKKLWSPSLKNWSRYKLWGIWIRNLRWCKLPSRPSIIMSCVDSAPSGGLCTAKLSFQNSVGGSNWPSESRKLSNHACQQASILHGWNTHGSVTEATIHTAGDGSLLVLMHFHRLKTWMEGWPMLMSLQIRPGIATCHHVVLELPTSWCRKTRDEQDRLDNLGFSKA